LRTPTVARLAAVTGTAPTTEQGGLLGSLPLTPGTGSLSRSCTIRADSGFAAKGAASDYPDLLERAVQQLLETRDALRLQFIPNPVGNK